MPDPKAPPQNDDTLFYLGLGAIAAAALGGAWWAQKRRQASFVGALSTGEPRKDCSKIQEFIYEYLKQEVDPYDFQYLIEEWAESELPEPEYYQDKQIDDLSEEEQVEFTQWLKDYLKGKHASVDDPAYLVMHSEEKLPPGTWLVHFTRTSFDEFDRGTTLEGMHLSTWKTASKTRCPDNLDWDKKGAYEVVFGFAFEADEGARYQRAYSRKYGQNVVIFQNDCASKAYHDGDDEYQVVFPVCSEYNTLSLLGNDYGMELSGEDENGNDLYFENLREAVEYMREKRATMPLHTDK